jgi:hypothetical protein
MTTESVPGWLAEMTIAWARVEAEEHRRRMEEREHRRRIVSALEDHARLLRVAAVIPDNNDPLESIDPTPESDLDFPVSQEDWDATYHFEHFQEWVFEN